ncbi:unnamed protein product [Fraxinus pennsylvanica]|uniref:Uncharacterized protein n=1 Tax=Fraxinus pennsylvanica TaxID=56036 RepID=A0AAD2EB85_9LAMI|nr:unnamed protein product [Fraxinus pennsylvanica]
MKKKGDKNQNVMGGTGSSSKRKSSKKKSSKKYSQVSRKKTIRRNESKKRGRRHDSDDNSINSASISASSSEYGYKSKKSKYKKSRRDYSISSDDNSMSAASDSLSSLHNDYRSRKAKSGSQLRRKRARERSISPDRNKNSHDVKKRKISKRSHDVKPKKKSLKKSKKHMRVSSSSSDSQSFSTYRSRSSDRTTEIGNAKVMFDKEIERASGRDAVKVHRKCRVRSPSYSSCSRDNDHSVSQTEVMATANNSRRLRSVIVVVEQPHDKEENKWGPDPNKEEIVYNDFPSPRSIESDDVGHKGESDYDSPGESNKKSRLGTVKGEEVTERSFTVIEGSGQKNNTVDTKSNEVDSNTFEKKRITDVSVSVTDLGGDDQESILRQKALENLRKYRGGLQTCTTNQKIDNESDVNNFSSAVANIIQNKSTKQDSSNVVCLTRETDHSSTPTLKRNLSHHKEIKKDITGEPYVGFYPNVRTPRWVLFEWTG